MMPPTNSINNDKISLNSATYDLIDGRTSPVSALEDGTYNSHLTIIDKSPSRSTELRRDLDERHVNMIAFSTTVGIGCFLQSGKIIAAIGPGGAVMAYLLMGVVIWSANAGLGEMTAVFPVKGPIIDFCSRFIDESVGFAVGWMAWFAYAILTATEVSVLSQTFQFNFNQDYLQKHGYPENPLRWEFGLKISPAVWATFGLALMLFINVLPVRIYGEIEYVFGCIKLIMMIMMIMYNVIISGIMAGQYPDRGRFWTYQGDYSFFTDKFSVEKHNFYGSTARLLAIWTAMNTIFFSLQGMFSVSVTAAENRRLETQESIKIATRKIALRTITLYALLVFSVGLNVPFDDEEIQDSSINAIRQGNHSPFIISAIRAHTTGLPHLLNAFWIFSAFSCGVNGLYTASRLLHALASVRNAWPTSLYWLKARLERTTTKGVPLAAVITSWLFGFLGYLGSSPQPSRILGRLSNLSSASMMIVYMCMGICFLFFKTCTIEAEPNDPVTMESDDSGILLNRAASNYPYRSHLQWARAAFAAMACFLFLFFNGFRTLMTPFKPADFIASYIAIPIFLLLVSLYHVKDERTWNPLKWSRRVTMNVSGPMETAQTDASKRRGRLHRKNMQRFWARENLAAFREFIWVWVK